MKEIKAFRCDFCREIRERKDYMQKHEARCKARLEEMITVCNKCLLASCVQGHFFCDEYHSAGTTEKTVAELKKLDLEHSDYWR